MQNLVQSNGFANSGENRLIPIKEVKQLLSLSTRTIYRRIADGTFPHPRKIGRKTLFLLSEIYDFMMKTGVKL
jgi:excisionase family DNA binding protein